MDQTKMPEQAIGTADIGGAKPGSQRKKIAGITIPLPTDALREIICFLPRAQRAPLVMVCSQMADVVVRTVNAERREVSPLLPTSPQRP